MEDHRVVRAVGGEDDGYYAVACSSLGHACRDPVDGGGQAAVGIAVAVGVDDRGAVGELAGRVGPEAGEEELRQADVRDDEIGVGLRMTMETPGFPALKVWRVAGDGSR